MATATLAKTPFGFHVSTGPSVRPSLSLDHPVAYACLRSSTGEGTYRQENR